ncbi:MAG: CoA transferase, partial [Dehalococcoidia bacterium]
MTNSDRRRQGETALAGLRVLELGEGQAVAYAGKLLAEFGADVVKVESPDGDPVRRRIPLGDGAQADSQLHRWLNNGKRSVVVGWRRDAAELRPLLDGADVVLSAVPVTGPEAPATAAALTPAALRDGREHLIVAHYSDFGPDGPLAQWMGGELALYALSGLLGASGSYDRPPLKHGAGVGWFTSGAVLALGVLVAQWERAAHGHGQVVDVAGLDCLVGAQAAIPFLHSFTGDVRRRAGKDARVDLSILPCKEGYVASIIGRDGWERFVALMGEPELMQERFLDRAERVQYMGEVLDTVLRLLQKRTKQEWFHEAQKLRLPYAPVQSARDVAECPQLNARGFFVVLEGADGRHSRMPGRPFLMSRTPWSMRRPAPLLGSATVDEIQWEPRPRPAATEPPTGLPLRGIRILELSTAWAGPYATKLLADLGADVLKIESHSHADAARVAPYADHRLGDRFFDRSAAYASVNTSKHHACLELSRPAARELLLRLLPGTDVVLENFPPRVMEKLRLTYDHLRAQRPDLIMLSSCGYGQSGPWRNYASYGWSLEPAGGLCDVTGYADGPPVASAIPYPDTPSAVLAAYAIMLALEYRRRTGEGQWIDLAQYEIAALSAVEPLLQYLGDGSAWGRRGNRHPWYAPHNIYPAAADGTALGSDDQWLALAVERDEEWDRLVHALAGALPDRPSWRSVDGRKADEDVIDQAIGEWSAQRTAEEGATALQAAGVRAA